MSEKRDNNSEILEISKRQVSLVSGVLLLLAASIFASGYFLGTYHAVESFTVKAEQDSFADQVYASLSALYDQDGGPSKSEVVEAVQVEVAEVAQPANQDESSNDSKQQIELEQPMQEIPAMNLEPVPALKETVSEPVEKHQDESKDQEINEIKKVKESKNSIDSFELVKNDKNNKRWQAQLIGYGLEKSAREFALKLTKKGFDVAVTKRMSRSAKGQQKAWYQVVTAAYENRDLLQKQVDKIVSLEKLKGVQISIC